MKDLKIFEKIIGITFKNKILLKNAFIHRSYLNENKTFKLLSNEKLEFLGDSVLSLITSVYLYKSYPLLHEGDYTEIKSSIVRTESLAEAARSLKLGDYLYLSKGEEINNGRRNRNIMADCFEALIAVIFIDQGFKKASSFVTKYLFKDRLNHLIEDKLYFSSKSRLQEYVQNKHKTIPVYKVLEEKGPEHKRIFRVGAYIREKKIAEGTGASKKEAEEKAARKVLEKMV